MSGLVWPKIELYRAFMPVLFTSNFDDDSSQNERNSTEKPLIGSKATDIRLRYHFPHLKSMEAFCCHGHQSFDPLCLKTLCCLSLPPVMLHIKFDQGWPTGLRDIQVRKCKNFVIQGQVTLKRVVRSSPKSNLSELLCLS